MKLTNKTKWRTADLLAFFRRVAKDELDPAHFKRLHATVVYTRGGPNRGYSSGHAYLRSNTMTLRVSAHEVDKVDMAHVIAHEMAHCRGLEHGAAMNSPRYRRVPGMRERYAWAEELPLRDTTVKAPRVTGHAADAAKLAAARAKVAAWDRKIKASETRRKGWVAKVKYYERKLAKPEPTPRPARPRTKPAGPRRGSLAALKADPRVLSVQNEGTDGFWVDLAPGWSRDGAHSVHEYSVRDLHDGMGEVTACDCDVCVDAGKVVSHG